MGRARQRDAVVQLNMIPLIDVMLVLLAIFMVTAPIMNVSDIHLPAVVGENHPPSHGNVLYIKISLDGIRFFGADHSTDRILTPSELRSELSSCNDCVSKEISILADEGVSYGRVMGVFSMLRSLGFIDLNLVVRDEVAT